MGITAKERRVARADIAGLQAMAGAVRQNLESGNFPKLKEHFQTLLKDIDTRTAELTALIQEERS